MAILIQKTVGALSGRVGNVIYRNQGGNTYAYAATTDFHMSMSDDSVNNRYRWKLYNFLASGIRKIYIYKTIWNNAPIKGRNIINKINSVNSHRITKDLDISGVMLVPAEDYFKVETADLTMEQIGNCKTYNLKIKPLKDSGVSYFDRPAISAQGLLCCYEPFQQYRKEFYFAPLLPITRELDFNKELEFNIKLQGADFIESEEYQKHTLLLNLITYNSNNEPCDASQNIFIILE